MSPSSHSSDPVEGFIEQSVADVFGPARSTQQSGSGKPSGAQQRSGEGAGTHQWFPLSVVPVAALAMAASATTVRTLLDEHVTDVLGTSSTSPVRIINAAFGWCADHWPLVVAVLVLTVVADVFRWYARRHRAALSGQVYATTYVQPRSVWVSWPPGWRAPRRAIVRTPVGTVINDKRYASLIEAITASANSYIGASWPMVGSVRKRFGLVAWVMSVQWQAGSGRLVITRARAVDAAASHTAQRKRLDAMLAERFPLPDARVTAVQFDDAGIECGFTIEFSPTIHAARSAMQQALRESLIAFLPPYPTAPDEAKRMWTVSMFPERETLVIELAADIPTYIPHEPVADISALSDEERFKIPFAMGAGDVVARWDVGPSTSKPHFLVVGPTGAGKTVMLMTIVTGAVMRGVPVLAIDPKRIELNGLEGYPGVAAVAYSLRQIVQLINAVHAEMMARSDYIAKTHIPADQLTPFIVIMDEFFVMSGFIQRAARYKGTDPELAELKDFVADSAPLAKHAEIMALIRKVGGRIATGVQRPDAKNFGEDAGSVRDNYGMRASASNVSRDGAEMMWESTSIGRDLDTSIPGRATVMGPDDTPMTAQVFWTPNVDPHPNAWSQLKPRDRKIVTALRDATDVQDITWYSAEMRAFLHTMTTTAPEPPTAIDGVDPSAAGDDGFRAETLQPGDTILGDDGRALTVESVDVTNTVVRVELSDPERPKVRHLAEYQPAEIVLAP